MSHTHYCDVEAHEWQCSDGSCECISNELMEDDCPLERGGTKGIETSTEWFAVPHSRPPLFEGFFLPNRGQNPASR
jgi:hypothetical protein